MGAAIRRSLAFQLGLRPASSAKGIMIIDCHGHYTTEPKDLHRFRKDQT